MINTKVSDILHSFVCVCVCACLQKPSVYFTSYEFLNSDQPSGAVACDGGSSRW